MTQPSSISVASGTYGRLREAEQPGGRRTAVAAIVGIMLGATVLASALVYRYTISRPKVIADGVTALDAGDVAAGPGSVSTGAAPTPVADVADGGAAQPSGEPGNAGAFNGIATASAATGALPPSDKPTGASATGTVATKSTTKPASKPISAVKPSTPAPVATPAAAGPDCTTPVWFDAQGVKHYKPQCLDK